MTPQQVYDSLPEPEEGRKYDWDVARSGYIKLEDLLEIVQHHSMRRCSVSSESFGLIDMDRRKLKQALTKMLEDIGPRMQERRREKGEETEMLASIYLSYNNPKSGRTWRVGIHTVGCFLVGDEQRRYYRLWS